MKPEKLISVNAQKIYVRRGSRQAVNLSNKEFIVNLCKRDLLGF